MATRFAGRRPREDGHSCPSATQETFLTSLLVAASFLHAHAADSTDRPGVLQVLIGPITVNGKKYTPVAAMPGLKHAPQITDAQLADVATFVRHAWNNRKGAVDAATI